MSAVIPRALVAAALKVDEAALPPGDLPLVRLAARYLGHVRAGMADGADADDVWTYELALALARDAPGLCLAFICACLAQADSPVDAAAIAAGPLEDLIAANGAAMIAQIETLARRAPRFGYALTGVWPPEGAPAGEVWLRIEAARGPRLALDEGDPLPVADGLA